MEFKDICFRTSAFMYCYRPKWEGGQYDGDENYRLSVLQLAMEFGADYIDIELQVAVSYIYEKYSLSINDDIHLINPRKHI